MDVHQWSCALQTSLVRDAEVDEFICVCTHRLLNFMDTVIVSE